MKKLRLRKEVREFLDKAFGVLVAVGAGILIFGCIRGGF